MEPQKASPRTGGMMRELPDLRRRRVSEGSGEDKDANDRHEVGLRGSCHVHLPGGLEKNRHLRLTRLS